MNMKSQKNLVMNYPKNKKITLSEIFRYLEIIRKDGDDFYQMLIPKKCYAHLFKLKFKKALLKLVTEYQITHNIMIDNQIGK